MVRKERWHNFSSVLRETAVYLCYLPLWHSVLVPVPIYILKEPGMISSTTKASANPCLMLILAGLIFILQDAKAATTVYLNTNTSNPLVTTLISTGGTPAGEISADTGIVYIPEYGGTVSAKAMANDLTGINNAYVSFDVGPTPGLPAGQTAVTASSVIGGVDLTLFPVSSLSIGSGLVAMTISYDFDALISLPTNALAGVSGGLEMPDSLHSTILHSSQIDFFAGTGFPPMLLGHTGNGTYSVNSLSPSSVDGTVSLLFDIAPGVPFSVFAALNLSVSAFQQSLAASGTIDATHTGTISFIAPDGYVLTSASGAFGLPAAVPEPETWAMLMIGLGMVGLAVRRRNSLAL